jgi:hypothetical protein
VSEADNDYELNVLRMVINQFLDESTSLTELSLNALESRRDQVVWDVTKRIYSQSGYRVELGASQLCNKYKYLEDDGTGVRYIKSHTESQ